MKSPPHLLLIDDDRLEAMFVKRTLRELGIANELVHKTNGEEALDYLLRESCALPCVILLDLNMPKMNGFEFLGQAKALSALEHIPVFVVTTSASELDKARCLELGAKDYIVKTLDLEQFRQDIDRIQHYCGLVTIP